MQPPMLTPTMKSDLSAIAYLPYCCKLVLKIHALSHLLQFYVEGKAEWAVIVPSQEVIAEVVAEVVACVNHTSSDMITFKTVNRIETKNGLKLLFFSPMANLQGHSFDIGFF